MIGYPATTEPTPSPDTPVVTPTAERFTRVPVIPEAAADATRIDPATVVSFYLQTAPNGLITLYALDNQGNATPVQQTRAVRELIVLGLTISQDHLLHQHRVTWGWCEQLPVTPNGQYRAPMRADGVKP